MSPHTKSAAPTTIESVRTVVREILVRDFEGNQSRMAQRLGISQSTISDILNPHARRGPGPVLFDALARYDVDLARKAWGLDQGGEAGGVAAIAGRVAADGVSQHVARVVARTALELGHDGDGAVRVARALATIVTALAPPAGSSPRRDAPAVEQSRPRVRRAQ